MKVRGQETVCIARHMTLRLGRGAETVTSGVASTSGGPNPRETPWEADFRRYMRGDTEGQKKWSPVR